MWLGINPFRVKELWGFYRKPRLLSTSPDRVFVHGDVIYDKYYTTMKIGKLYANVKQKVEAAK